MSDLLSLFILARDVLGVSTLYKREDSTVTAPPVAHHLRKYQLQVWVLLFFDETDVK
jgi:hypothetical protein